MRGGDADLNQQITGRLGVHGDALLRIIDDAHGADQQRGRYRNDLAAFGAELVVERILTGDERRAIGQRSVVTGLGGADEGAEMIRPLTVGPAEVIENRNAIRSCADADRVAHRLVDCRQRHPVWIDVAQSRGQAARDGQALL